jgi:16S rRNA processing protein RimM
MAEGGYLAVARLKKPHGLKGEVVVWSLTDDPEEAFAVGRELQPIDEDGNPTGDPVLIERCRPFHREWLLKFEGVADRTTLEGWRQRLFGMRAAALRPPGDDELYVHEVPGTKVTVGGAEVGVAREVVDLPGGGRLLAVEVGGREVLVPFRKPIVTRIDRNARVIELDPPDGLLEL